MIERPILIIDDDLTLCRSIQNRMQGSDVVVVYAESSLKSFEYFRGHKYCLVIMDIQLTGISGLEVLRTIRSTRYTPILVLARELDSKKKIALLKAGADVCFEKPIEIDVCVAQAQALIQHYKGGIGMCGLLTYGTELVINLRYREVLVCDQPLSLTRKEFDLFFALPTLRVRFSPSNSFTSMFGGKVLQSVVVIL